MAHSFYFNDETVVGIDEYVEWMEANVNFDDKESILASAPKLHQLSNNRCLLDDVITSILTAPSGGIQQANVYTDATFILAMSSKKRFFVRANVWKTPQMRNGSYDWENQHYSYLYPHDHNFDFMTVGYHGSGYRTEIFEYDSAMIQGYPGEKVALTVLEDTRLEKGKVMYYRKSTDVHIQHPPETLSISLNLMIRHPDQKFRQQYEFDVVQGTIASFVTGDISLRTSIVDIAAQLGGDKAIDALQSLAADHACHRTRRAAYAGLLKSGNLLKASIQESIARDPSILVRSLLNKSP